MATGKGRAVAGQLRTLFNVGAIRELSDGQLLERFATDRGETGELAFAALVERHGPMVLRVCRGVLADPHDAQDAFQATFLVLVRKARALWVHDSIGPWLHQVACRTAMCARRAAACRRRHERSAAALAREGTIEPPGELEWAIHEEIDRLPESFRAPVVLCDLGGRTHEQAARHLGWAIGTVKSRHSRGRERLRERLRRRGFGPDTGLLAAVAGPHPEAAIPTSLIQSTTAAAVRLAATRTLVEGSAAVLAQEILRSMFIARWLKGASLVLLVGAMAFGIDSAGQDPAPGVEARAQATARVPRDDAAPAAGDVTVVDGVEVTRAKRDTLTVSLTERGSLESANAPDVFSQIEGVTSIISIVPERTRVKKGQLVCELDSAALKDRFTNQIISMETAKAAYENAKLAREAAEIAVAEYENGSYKQDLQAVLGEIRLAEVARRNAEARLERTRQALGRLKDSAIPSDRVKAPSEVVALLDLDDRLADAEQAVTRATLELEQATTKRDVLTRFTKDKMTRKLKVDLENARSIERAREQALDLETSKKSKLEKQIQLCNILAPSDGIVVYARDPRPSNANLPAIEEGAAVRERQKILSVVDDTGPMRVLVLMPEGWVDQVWPGARTRIKIDAFPNAVLTGVVESVAPRPGPQSTGPRKVYPTYVRIEEHVAGLRPGMTAQAVIELASHEDVLSVPAMAVHKFRGKSYVALAPVPGQRDEYTWREVRPGLVGDDRVEIREGIQSGESIAVNPQQLIVNNKIRPRPETTGKRAARPDEPR